MIRIVIWVPTMQGRVFIIRGDRQAVKGTEDARTTG